MSCISLFEKFDAVHNFCVPVSAEEVAAVDFNGMKTLLANYLSATYSFPSALRNIKTCLSASSNLCGKIV